MTPPKLARDTPVANIFQPVIVSLYPALGAEFDLSTINRFKRRFGKRFHFNKPLFRKTWLNRNMRAFTVANFMNMFFNFIKQAKFLKIFDNSLATNITIHTLVFFRNAIIHAGIFIHDIQEFKFMAQPDLIIVRIVSGGDLNCTCSKFHINVRIFNNGNLAISQRKKNSFTNEVSVTLIFGINGNGCIAQHGFGAGGCNNKITVFLTLNRIFEVP